MPSGIDTYIERVVGYYQCVDELGLTAEEAQHSPDALEHFARIEEIIKDSPELLCAYGGVIQRIGRNTPETLESARDIEYSLLSALQRFGLIGVDEREKRAELLERDSVIEQHAIMFGHLFAPVVRLYLVSHPLPSQGQATKEAKTKEEPIKRKEKISVSGRSDSVGRYLDDIGRYPLLTKEDEYILGSQVQNGIAASNRLADPPVHYSNIDRNRDVRAVQEGVEAKTTMINANLRLVVSVAKRYPYSSTNTENFLDIIQEGNLGLEHAVDKFNPEKGFKFSTYAVYWIRQSIGRYIKRKSGQTSISMDISDDIERYDKAMAIDTPENEILEAFGWSREHLYKVQEAKGVAFPVSIQTEIGEESSLEDFMSDSKASAEFDKATLDEDIGELHEILNSLLKPDELSALLMRSGYNETGGKLSYRQIAAQYNITPEAARRRYERAIQKLQHPSIRSKLSQYYDLLTLFEHA